MQTLNGSKIWWSFDDIPKEIHARDTFISDFRYKDSPFKVNDLVCHFTEPNKSYVVEEIKGQDIIIYKQPFVAAYFTWFKKPKLKYLDFKWELE
jgi:hypothetical protein